MEVNLRVTPEDLKAKAGQITSEIDQVEKQWNRVQEIVTSSSAYWKGDASQAHQKLLCSFSAEATSILRRLRVQPINLQKMAGVYTETEASARAAAASLPTNTIR